MYTNSSESPQKSYQIGIPSTFRVLPWIMMELPYPPTTVQLVDNRTKEATEKRKQAKEALNEAAWATPPDSYQIRDKVWLEATHLALPYQTPKLTPKCHRPFEIVKRVLPVTYQLKLLTAWTIHDVFHASLLTLYRKTMEHRVNYMRPPPDLIKDSKEYEVEAIVKHRHFGCKWQLQYLIKWKGYPNADNMWELADHVHASTLIQAYHWKNLLSPSEQDKRSRKKCKVSIHSLKSFLQWHHISPTTICLPPQPASSPKVNSPCQPPPLSTTPLNSPLIHLPQDHHHSDRTTHQLTTSHACHQLRPRRRQDRLAHPPPWLPSIPPEFAQCHSSTSQAWHQDTAHHCHWPRQHGHWLHLPAFWGQRWDCIAL